MTKGDLEGFLSRESIFGLAPQIDQPLEKSIALLISTPEDRVSLNVQLTSLSRPHSKPVSLGNMCDS